MAAGQRALAAGRAGALPAVSTTWKPEAAGGASRRSCAASYWR
jgi:hypothetical protein